ncbi:MAG: ATP-binding cassette domain-containing protein [Bacteroidales bacterium]|nr:ATP-binding cassette domain-containing protein [Bacteroidales bacterium]
MNLVNLINVEPFIYGVCFNGKINLSILKGENPTIIGANGAGKSKLADIICGKVTIKSGEMNFSFLPKGVLFKKGTIIKAGFESAYTMADYSSMYYQQRFNATENDFTPTVLDLLNKIDNPKKDFWIKKLKLESLFNKHLIMLSSGELRRFLIANILMQNPEIIIFDNPFIGLDIDTKHELNQLFTEIANQQEMIFIIPDPKEIPDVSKSVIPVKNMQVLSKISKEEFLSNKEFQQNLFPTLSIKNTTLPIPEHTDLKPFNIVAKLSNITIKYPTRTLFENLNWTILQGEKWALTGKNGSGKSTLLSLITADNPKAYNMDITLFDKKRGTGESIWDIKKRIGYISSEMHLFFRENQPCIKVVASGLFDTQGLYRQCNENQYEKALQIMKIFGIENLANNLFLKTSDGEQRLVLLARTMIKNPDLLILDEPLHGLDAINKNHAKNIINQYSMQKNRTIIIVTHNPENIPECITKKFELL